LAFEFSNILMDFNEYLLGNILAGCVIAGIAKGYVRELRSITFKEFLKGTLLASFEALNQL